AVYNILITRPFLCFYSQIRLVADLIERWLTRCSVRKAGGAIGKRQVAEEERYFRWKEKEQMEVLRKHHTEETEEIYRHEGKIQKVKDDE
uniref:ATPase inhibitor, mitochondrial n=1 Tax=Labrus bergylta TaxID=56723 RepID=A0A3Q3NRJ9_9LABR